MCYYAVNWHSSGNFVLLVISANPKLTNYPKAKRITLMQLSLYMLPFVNFCVVVDSILTVVICHDCDSAVIVFGVRKL